MEFFFDCYSKTLQYQPEKYEMEGMSTKDVSMMLRDNDFPEETIENLKSELVAALD